MRKKVVLGMVGGSDAKIDLSLPLFGTAHARLTDPETSHEAAAKITPHLSFLQGVVLAELELHGPCSDRNLVTVCKAKHGRTESTWRTRRAELVAKGLVERVEVIEGHSIWRVKT